MKILLLDSAACLERTKKIHAYTAHIIGHWHDNGTIKIIKDRYFSNSGMILEPCDFDRYIEEISIIEEYRSLFE